MRKIKETEPRIRRIIERVCVPESAMDDATHDWKFHRFMRAAQTRRPEATMPTEPRRKRAKIAEEKSPQMSMDIFGKVAGK